MAVVAVKSTQITNRDTIPIAHVAAAFDAGTTKGAGGTVEIANGDSIASTYRFFDVPSNAVVDYLRVYCDAITSAAADFGIYQTTQNGGAVVDADFFGSAVSLAAAITTGTDITHEADATDAGVGYGLADIEKFLWQNLQLTADPARSYDVVATLTAAATAAGTLALRMQYRSNV